MLWVPWKVQNKFIMKWKRKLIFCEFLKLKFADFLSMSKSSFTVIYRKKFLQEILHTINEKCLGNKVQNKSRTAVLKFIMGSIKKKVQNRWDLSLKNIVFTFIMLRGTHHCLIMEIKFFTKCFAQLTNTFLLCSIMYQLEKWIFLFYICICNY